MNRGMPPSMARGMARGPGGPGGPGGPPPGRGPGGPPQGRGPPGGNLFGSQQFQAPPMKSAADARFTEAPKSVYKQEVDTNIYQISLACLKD